MSAIHIDTFRVFKNRNYRLYFYGQSTSLIGTWMQKTAVSWVIYSLTHSKFMLGVTLFASMFPSFLFSFLGGVVADRYNRYRVRHQWHRPYILAREKPRTYLYLLM